MRCFASRVIRVVASMVALCLCFVLGAGCGGAGGGDPSDDDGNGRLWVQNAATRAPPFFTCDGTLPNTLLLTGVVCRHSDLDFDEDGDLVSLYGPPIEFTFAALDPAGQVLAGNLSAAFPPRTHARFWRARRRTDQEGPGPRARRRSAWARVLQKVFEVDPLLCPKCGTPMKVVAWITDPVVIERILTHRKRAGLESPFDARGPPDA